MWRQSPESLPDPLRPGQPAGSRHPIPLMVLMPRCRRTRLAAHWRLPILPASVPWQCMPRMIEREFTSISASGPCRVLRCTCMCCSHPLALGAAINGPKSEVLHERIEVSVAVQKPEAINQATDRNHHVNRSSNRSAAGTKPPKVLRRSPTTNPSSPRWASSHLACAVGVFRKKSIHTLESTRIKCHA